MKQQFMKSAITTAVLGVAMFAAGSAAAGSIVNTKHNLGVTGTGPNSTTGTEEICIFCHTPHGGATTDASGNPIAVPLWNKVLTNPANFKTYDQLGTSTYDAAQAPIGSVTLGCLTCHDGTQAIDNIINAPGSGGYLPGGGGTDGLDWAWTTATTVDATGRFLAGPDTAGSNIKNLGTDLTNDHPVSMQYGGGGVSASNPAGPTRDSDFKIPDRVGSTDRWYVDNVTMGNSMGATLGAFDKWDFNLYTRDSSGLPADARGVAWAGENEPFVECGSCHDPHMETDTFLRIDGSVNAAGPSSNSGSAICLACHTK